MVQARFEQFRSEQPGLKFIDSGAVSHVQLSRTLRSHEGEARAPS